jgi:hypothetical protein
MTGPAAFECRYWALISYNSKDVAQAEWLHRAIETYTISDRVWDAANGQGMPDVTVSAGASGSAVTGTDGDRF